MRILDIVNRMGPPLPWAEGDNIPWNDPEFSEQMLKEHLCHDHDHASRRLATIDQQVKWIHHELLNCIPTRILDLGCGPGLFANLLSKLGHSCVCIDFSPASITYAKEQALKENLPCKYLLNDIREANYGDNFGLILLIFGEFNSFNNKDTKNIVTKAYNALQDNGILLLEPHTFEAVKEMAEPRSSWSAKKKGLFSLRPYLCLEERYWDAIVRASTTRYYILDGVTGDVMRYAQTAQAYTNEEYLTLLSDCGFSDITFFPSLTGSVKEIQKGLQVITAKK
ncbi:MAG: class I SAM-dependent methyltransferase [Candidatus Bathyarchaeota archaeon]|nr:class I SAM-dependent methyltransferase [Candidatus Bathyarchaeota archaeon]